MILELKPEIEARLRVLAAAKGETLESLALARLESSFSEEDLEMLEDAEDLAEAKRRLAENDPAERKSLDDLRKAWKQ